MSDRDYYLDALRAVESDGATMPEWAPRTACRQPVWTQFASIGTIAHDRPVEDAILEEVRPAGTYTWIPFGGGVRRCLAASYSQMLMKEVIGTVISEVDLRAVEARSERARKSAIAFVPERHGRVTMASSGL